MTLGIPKAVWVDMGPRAQKLAHDAAEARKVLASTPLLVRAGATMSAAEAGDLGVAVLHESTGTVELGVCGVPPVSKDVMSLCPKGA